VAAYVLLLLFEQNKYTGLLSEVLLNVRPTPALTTPDGQSAAIDIVMNFRHLIEQHFGDQWRIQDYCEALGARVSELAGACRDVLGCAPSTLIHERVLLDAKRRLTYSRASVSEIAYEIGFSDAAYFSRFFKRQTGVSPGQFRRTYVAQRSEA
jgi:AraC family transcriptional activator of pobA